MSLATVETIRDRALHSRSGIAIFGGIAGIGYIDKEQGRKSTLKPVAGSLDAVFAKTARCQFLIKKRRQHYICTIGSWMTEEAIDTALQLALCKSKMMTV